jgi:hypothetical protein
MFVGWEASARILITDDRTHLLDARTASKTVA